MQPGQADHRRHRLNVKISAGVVPPVPEDDRVTASPGWAGGLPRRYHPGLLVARELLEHDMGRALVLFIASCRASAASAVPRRPRSL